MNGTQYMKPSFTLPASDNASELNWDAAFLTKKEFLVKHPKWDSHNYDVMFKESFYETRERRGRDN
jgi:hypothetical protein